ncbi:MAG: S8 family serine peptidase [Solirubrobacteraceae bacterium]
MFAPRSPTRYPSLAAAVLAVVVSALLLGAGPAWAAGGYVRGELLVGYQSADATASAVAFEAQIGVSSRRPAPAPHSEILHLRHGESVTAAARRLRRQPGVAFAEPNYIAHQTGAFYPDDRGRAGTPGGWTAMQWNLLPGMGIDAPTAWANLLAVRRPGGRGVRVAILDTGVAYRRWHHFRRSPDFGNTHFVAPYDFIADNRFPLDRNGHGTFVAGVVGESTNNNIGLTGIAYGASIMPVRVLDAGGLGDENTIARGIRYAVTHGAQVINLSLEFLPNEVSSSNQIPEIVSAINFAHRRRVIVVGAAGNDQDTRLAYPARARNVISVGATTRDRCLAGYSNGGAGLDLVAPGGGTDALMPSDADCLPDRSLPSIYQMTLVDPPHWSRFGYPGYYIGTSMSAPAVSAAAALVIASGVLGRRPRPVQVLARLEQTATPLGSNHPNDQYGYGLLNVGAATAPTP